MKLLPVTQRGLECYEERRYEESQAAEEQHSTARFNRCLLTAARAAGFAAELPEDLTDLLPWQVEDYSKQIIAHVAAAKAPPDPN
jgi:hypothetical protein